MVGPPTDSSWVGRPNGGKNMNSNMETKTKNGSLWNRFVSLFRPRDRQLIKEEMRKEEIRQLIIEVLDADWSHGIADAIYSANHGEIASDIREVIDTYEIAQEFDTYDIGQEISEDVAYNLDVSDVAQHLNISETVDNAVENHLHQIIKTAILLLWLKKEP